MSSKSLPSSNGHCEFDVEQDEHKTWHGSTLLLGRVVSSSSLPGGGYS
jgi:hypothetical protein